MSFVSFNNLPSSSANVLAIKQQQPPPVVDLDVLQAASRVLQEQLLKDAQIIPDHGEMFAYSAYLHLHLVHFRVFLCKTAGSSGQYSVFPDDYRVPFLKRKLAGIPEGLFQYFTGA
jgi:nuclear pore complex protein Nup155